MAFRLFVATTVALAVGLFAAAEPLAQVKPGQPTAAAATAQVTATPQAAVIPQAGTKPPAPAPAEVNRDRRDAQPGAAPKDDKPLVTFFELRDRAAPSCMPSTAPAAWPPTTRWTWRSASY